MSRPFDKLKSSLNDLIFEDNTEQEPEQKQPVEDAFSSHEEPLHTFRTEHEPAFKEPDPVVEQNLETEPQPQSQLNPEEEDGPVVEVKPVGTSVITESTVITGNMKTESHVKVEGVIQGNVETKANITIVGGKVIGNIKGGMVGTKAAMIKGDIVSNEIVEILEESFIEGNIMGDKIYIAGHIIGNINSTGTLSLSSNAVVEGDIITKRLRVEEDAIINGKISMNR